MTGSSKMIDGLKAFYSNGLSHDRKTEIDNLKRRIVNVLKGLMLGVKEFLSRIFL